MSNIKNRAKEFKEKHEAAFKSVMEQMAAHFDDSIQKEGGISFLPFCSDATLKFLKGAVDSELEKRAKPKEDDFSFSGKKE